MRKENRFCNNIQRMIIMDKIGALSDSDRKRMREHIEICPECAAYGETLELLTAEDTGESILTGTDLNVLREKLTAQIRIKNKKSTGVWFTDWIRHKLTRRIPLYQAAIAFVLLLIITVTALKGTGRSLNSRGDFSGITGLTGLDTLQIEQLDNIGRSSLEDSTLIRLTVTSL